MRVDALFLQLRYRSLTLGKITRTNQHCNALFSQLPCSLQTNPPLFAPEISATFVCSPM